MSDQEAKPGELGEPPLEPPKRGLLAAFRESYGYGKRRLAWLETTRAEQWILWLQARQNLRDAREELRIAEQTQPQEMINLAALELDRWKDESDHAEKNLQLLNAERDRFMGDQRAMLAIVVSVLALILSIVGLIVKL